MAEDLQIQKPPIWFLYVVTGIGLMSTNMITPNIPDVLDEFSRSDGSAGVLVAAGAFPGVFAAPVIGVLADRVGRKRVLLPCLVIFAVGAALTATAQSFGTLIGARLVQALGGAGLINLALVLIADHWTGLERTKLIGRNSAVLTTTLAVLPSLAGGIAEVSNWRWAVAVGGLSLPVAVLGLFLLPDSKPEVVRQLGPQLKAAAAELRRPEMFFVFLAGFLLFVVIFGVFLTALPVHLEEQFDLGPGVRGLVLSIPAVGAIVASFNLGRIRAVVALRTLLVAGALCVAVAAFGAAVAPVLVLMIASVAIYGFGDGALIPALQDVASSVPSPDQRASVMAVWVSAIRLGQSAGPIGAAMLFAATSTSTAMLVGAAIFAAVGMLFAFGPIDDRVMEEAEIRP